MIDKETARGLLPLVNDDHYYVPLQAYVADRVASLHKLIEQATDYNTVLKLQGQIVEVRRLSTLRAEARADVDK